MGRIFLLVGTGGFLGSIARYLTAIWFTKHSPAFPYEIFAPHNAPSFNDAIKMGVETFHGLKDLNQ